MKRVRLEKYLEGRMKKDLAAAVNVSPALVSKCMTQVQNGEKEYWVMLDAGKPVQLYEKRSTYRILGAA